MKNIRIQQEPVLFSGATGSATRVNIRTSVPLLSALLHQTGSSPGYSYTAGTQCLFKCIFKPLKLCAPPALVFAFHPYLNILNSTKHFVADAIMKKNQKN